MLHCDRKDKKKGIEDGNSYWDSFIIPHKDFYTSLVTEMDSEYSENGSMCPCCLKTHLLFLQSQLWQASKDRMVNGVAYGDTNQKVRWTCLFCNRALQKMPDWMLKRWFHAVIDAKDIVLRSLYQKKVFTDSETKYLKNVVLNNCCVADAKVELCSCLWIHDCRRALL